MTTYETQFNEKLGASNEKINVKFEYCEDFNGDGFKDVKVTLSLDPSSNSGTEDIIGVAFDIQNDAIPSNLQVLNIQRSSSNGTLSTYSPTSVIGANLVSDANGFLNPGFSTSGGGSDEPYDIGIKFSDQGSGEGIVQSASFVLSAAGVHLDAEALLENTDWWVRLQSTDGGGESAKTGGFVLDLPPCVDEPPTPPGEDGIANTPGFWKQSQHFQFWQQPYDPTDSFKSTFGVNISLPFTDSLLGALSAGGGGINALSRAGTAALLNAASDEAGSGINYIIDEDALAISVFESGANLTSVLATLDIIDSNNDGRIGTTEVKAAVNDALTLGGNFNGSSGYQAVALAFDTMNNMPSLEVGAF